MVEFPLPKLALSLTIQFSFCCVLHHHPGEIWSTFLNDSLSPLQGIMQEPLLWWRWHLWPRSASARPLLHPSYPQPRPPLQCPRLLLHALFPCPAAQLLLSLPLVPSPFDLSPFPLGSPPSLPTPQKMPPAPFLARLPPPHVPNRGPTPEHHSAGWRRRRWRDCSCGGGQSQLLGHPYCSPILEDQGP